MSSWSPSAPCSVRRPTSSTSCARTACPSASLGITCFRPWPTDEIRAALSGASQVIVLNRALSIGSGSILGQDIRLTLAGESSRVHDVVVGLGGRPVTRHVLRRLVEDVREGRVSDSALTFPDLDIDLVARELARESATEPGGVLEGAAQGRLGSPRSTEEAAR